MHFKNRLGVQSVLQTRQRNDGFEDRTRTIILLRRAILVRAIGPTLSQFNISPVLANPILELHDANGSVFVNDDWRETQEAEIKAATLAPSNDKESAILATLVPGSYTAIVKGKDKTTGIGLVEAYKIK